MTIQLKPAGALFRNSRAGALAAFTALFAQGVVGSAAAQASGAMGANQVSSSPDAIPSAVEGDREAMSEAERKAQAKQCFERALELIAEEAYGQAAVELEQAYTLSPHPRVLYNLGMTYAALGQAVKAVQSLALYLEKGGKDITPARRKQAAEELARQRERVGHLNLSISPNDAVITVDGVSVASGVNELSLDIGEHLVRIEREGYFPIEQRITVNSQQRANLQATLEKLPDEPPPAALGQVTVRCAVPGASVLLDGNPVGQTPLAAPLSVTAGVHRVAFKAVGYRDQDEVLQVVAGNVTQLDCKLAAYPQSTAPLAPPPKARAESQEQAQTLNTLAWVFTGAAVAAAVGTGIVWWWNDNRYDSWSSEENRLNGAVADGSLSSEEAAPLYAQNDEEADSIATWDRIVIGGAVGALAFGATGGVLWGISDRTEHSAQVVPWVGLGTMGIRGRF